MSKETIRIGSSVHLSVHTHKWTLVGYFEFQKIYLFQLVKFLVMFAISDAMGGYFVSATPLIILSNLFEFLLMV